MWNPQVEQRPHPFGEAGITSSLEEVCRRAARGASDVLGNAQHLARVRTWSIERLHRAKQRGERVVTPGDRARILLAAVQNEKLWVPDPIGVEYIPAAHLLACDGDTHDDGTPCVKGDDCDGKVVFLAACFMSVGLYTMIVGHSYSADRIVGHVLTKVYFDEKWHYADASQLGDGSYMPLGRCITPTREIYYSLPEIRVVCDGTTCAKQTLDPYELGFVQKGTFVGLNGITVFELPPEAAVRWLGEVRWLGDVGGDSWGAIYKKGQERNFGTGKDDIDAYATAGSSVAAAGACVAAGQPEAAPLCATIGGFVGGTIADMVQGIAGGLFGGGTPQQEPNDVWNPVADRAIAGIVAAVRAKKGLDTDNPPGGSARNWPEWGSVAPIWAAHANAVIAEKGGQVKWFYDGTDEGEPGRIRGDAVKQWETTCDQPWKAAWFNFYANAGHVKTPTIDDFPACQAMIGPVPEAMIRATQETSNEMLGGGGASTSRRSLLVPIVIGAGLIALGWWWL